MKCSWLRSIFRWINLSILALRYASPWVFHRRNFFSRLETNVHLYTYHDVSDPVSIIQDGDKFTFTPRSWRTTLLSTSASNQPHLLTDLQNQTLTAQKCIALLKQLEMPVSSLPGVGPRTEEALHRLGLFNVRSLLFHFPTSFIDRSSLCKDINNVPDGELCTVVVTVEFIVRNPQYIRAKCRDPSGNTLFIRWFHGSSARGKNFAIAISKTLGNLPSRRIISGRLKWNDNHTVAEIINPQLVKKVDEIKAVQRIEPIYKLTEGLTQSKMIQTIDYAIQIGSALLREIPEFLPEELLLQLSWPTLADSLILAHSPSTVVSLKRGRASAAMTPARLRLAFQEFITQQVFLEITRWRYKNTFYFPKSTLSDSSGRIVFQQIVSTWEESPLIQMALQSLPYSLTQSQKRCLGELWKDALGYTGGMSRMARLLHGDVGSGKTVVAFLLALGCIEHPQLSNIVAFLSPTTLLAQQHVETLRTFVDGLDRHRCYFENGNGSVRSIHIEYLTGAITGVKRKQILDRITNCTKDEAVIVVGTHALISDEVTNTFSMIHRTKDDRISVVPGLALAIIDEEQRLGVEQRDSLIRYAAHTLYMSATPIPRTLALSKSTKKLSELTIGALDVSLLDEKPASAKNVTTSIVNINDVEKVIIGVQRQIAMGAKVFWIVPVIGNEEEGEDTENAIEGQLDHSMTVVKRFQQLSEYLGHEKVGMVHGRMASAERSRQLELFADRKSDMSIIVGTTVLEVGIDIPSVSILVVEEADRFGLSQLHQLRGRIGRASSLKEIIDHHEKILDCYCVLLTDVFSSDCKKEVARRRLDILRKSTDGKRIAEVDLMLRGPGEQLGERQAGLIGGGWSIDLRYHWDLELPASLLSRFFIKREQFFELSDSLNFDDLPAEIKLSNEFDILASFIGRTKSTEKIFHSPFASLLLRVYLCLFGRWNQAEWNTLRALETLRMIEVGRRYDDELEMMFINMADEIMGTKSLPSVLAPQDSSNEMAEQTEQKVKPSFAGNAVLFLILDIETTGLSPKSDYIIQLAAKVLGSDKGFCKYIQPPIKLPKNIESMTGITDDFLRRGGIDHVTGYHYNSAAGAFIDVYNDFCAFCREVSQREGKPLVMVAHNSAFELRMINSEIKRVIAASINKSGNVSPFSCLSQDTGIISVVDSLALLRTKQLWRSDFTLSTSREKAAPLPESFSLDTIYQHIFGRGILNGHNAVADVLALEKILSSPSLNDWKPLAEKMQQSLVLHNYN